MIRNTVIAIVSFDIIAMINFTVTAMVSYTVIVNIREGQVYTRNESLEI